MNSSWILICLLFPATVAARIESKHFTGGYADQPSAAFDTIDTDRDFLASINSHGRTVINFARAELAATGDPSMQRLARQIISNQHSELASAKSWLQSRAVSEK